MAPIGPWECHALLPNATQDSPLGKFFLKSAAGFQNIVSSCCSEKELLVCPSRSASLAPNSYISSSDSSLLFVEETWDLETIKAFGDQIQQQLRW